ncbi:MAG: hypothetical protein J1E38_02125 [Paramuribaculum sp.]|nr:hypothetical protein [Paramuribaculum sp.]
MWHGSASLGCGEWIMEAPPAMYVGAWLWWFGQLGMRCRGYGSSARLGCGIGVMVTQPSMSVVGVRI